MKDIAEKLEAQAKRLAQIAPQGYSPVELLISQTNKYFQASQLKSRPIVQFQDLFKGVEFTPQQKLAAVLAKHEFDQKFTQANRLEQHCCSHNAEYIPDSVSEN